MRTAIKIQMKILLFFSQKHNRKTPNKIIKELVIFH